MRLEDDHEGEWGRLAATGFATGPVMSSALGSLSPMDAEQARERLGQERERLEGLRHEYDSLHEASEDDAMHELSHYDQHQADTGTETFDRERDFSILEEIEGELADVEHALQRLDEGTYGTCEACGSAIPDERLEALPATRFCLNDQALAEQESKTSAATSEAE